MAMYRHMIFICAVLSVSRCTVDLNIHQMQFVADHLDITECRKLVAALSKTSFELSNLPVDAIEPDRPCIGLLLQWDREEGHGASFDDLALRLAQIGRHDLSDKISQTVYEEKAKGLDESFLNDPFKKTVNKDSILIDEKSKKVEKMENKTVESAGLEAWEIASIVSGSLIAFCFVTYGVYWLFGTAIARAFKQYAPTFLVKWVDLVQNQWNWVFKRTKRRYMKEVVGSKLETGCLGISEKRERSLAYLAELNRNLNYYLNNNSHDALLYYDELLRNFR